MHCGVNLFGSSRCGLLREHFCGGHGFQGGLGGEVLGEVDQDGEVGVWLWRIFELELVDEESGRFADDGRHMPASPPTPSRLGRN